LAAHNGHGGRDAECAVFFASTRRPAAPDESSDAAFRRNRHCPVVLPLGLAARGFCYHDFVIQIAGDAFAGMISMFIGAVFALAEKIMAAVSALSGEGSPRFRMSPFDSWILIRPWESTPT
jgi:hypothetical protein